MKKNTNTHRIINTSVGEVMLKQNNDSITGECYCEVYIGDNYDEYAGDIPCCYDDSDEHIEYEVERLFGI